MTATPVCFSRTKSRLARITRLDACGVPVSTGTLNSVTTDGWVKVTAKMNVENGTDFTAKNAWGDLILTDQDPDRLKSVDLQIDFVKVDPDIVGIVSGVRSIVQVQATGGPSTVGTTIGWAAGSNPVTSGFGLEMWTKISGVNCTNATPIWLYTVYPWVYNGKILDETYEDATLTFSMSGTTHAASTWGASPYVASPPSPDLTIAAGEHYGHILTTAQPPAVVCGAVAIA